MARRTVTSKNKQKMVQDFTAALMRMAQDVANNPHLHTKDWAKELGTQEWLTYGKRLHQLEKDKKAIRAVLQERQVAAANLNAQAAELEKGYEKLPEYRQEMELCKKWQQYEVNAENTMRESRKIISDLSRRNPKCAERFKKNPARIGWWTVFVTGLFGFNAYAAQVEKYEGVIVDSAQKKDGYAAKTQAVKTKLNQIVEKWNNDHKDEISQAKEAASAMNQKLATTRSQLDTHERDAANQQAQVRAHFKKVFEGKLSPAAQKEFNKHLEHVHAHKVAPTNPTPHSDLFSDNLFMQYSLWILINDYDSSYSSISTTAESLATSSATNWGSQMLYDYGLSEPATSPSSYGHSSPSSDWGSTSDSDTGSSSHSHSSWSPSPSSSCGSSSCGSSCGGGGD